jgi:hypothetical protein
MKLFPKNEALSIKFFRARPVTREEEIVKKARYLTPQGEGRDF